MSGRPHESPSGMTGPDIVATPASFCRALLDAMEASEGRRKRRARDTTADAIGMRMKRELLAAAAAAAPSAGEFEGWLLERCLEAGVTDGPVRAMALSIWHEWQLAASTVEFRDWLARGAPSDDREPGGPPRRDFRIGRAAHEEEAR